MNHSEHRPWTELQDALAGSPASGSAKNLISLGNQFWNTNNHGDLPRWLEALDGLPVPRPLQNVQTAVPALGGPVENSSALKAQLMEFHPWRKGPFCLGGVTIDAEWRSDWKWERIAPYLDLQNHRVLDVGCGNGYFGWRMLAAGAKCVVGIDPTILFVVQWLVQMHFSMRPDSPHPRNFVLPLKDSQLPETTTGFDSVFSMGVLYHRRDPADHLERLGRCLRPGGTLVLETLVLDQPGKRVLVPDGRYARMRNVWFIPTVDALLEQLTGSGFAGAQVVDLNRTSTDEQRSTEWMRFESLKECLDPEDPHLTVEGYPSPVRATIVVNQSV